VNNCVAYQKTFGTLYKTGEN